MHEGHHLLREGRLREGFDLYELRLANPSHGEIDLAARAKLLRSLPDNSQGVAVRSEQGFGDVIQFARYLPKLAEYAKSVDFFVYPEIYRLAKLSFPRVNVILAPEGASINTLAYDGWTSLMSLPRIFGTTLETIPTTIPYVTANGPDADRFDKLLPNRPRVGVAWAGRDIHTNDAARSIPLASFAKLFTRREVNFVCLQKWKREGDAERLRGLKNVLDITPELADFADTAAVVCNLDLVVCVDTAVAHLAGALGIPVMLLLPHDADWRWLTEREDSPWYPTLRLFRQSPSEEWSDVLRRVKRAIP
jgi:hypothetical protein